ncbi:MAG TPA: ABC transporter ATP-binding protein [Actinomycetes bacterium]|jgi:branched-chain amino acid transport system ATP-binding protein|nr:ABC transporter ATP-binding protein [Actinomycetes bacterium]
MALLELDGLSKSFGALKVIDGLDVRLEEGEALGVVGPNGAGKTTMLHLVAGQLRPDAGRVRFAGRDVTGLPARARCQLGLARTYQVPQPFAGMTVYENVLVGASFGGREQRDRAEDAHRASLDALALAELVPEANRLAGSLTLLERKRLELARALATGPRLLLLDEVAGGLTEPEVHRLVATIRRVRQAGVSVVWIEHIVHALLSVVDRIVAIDFGRKLIEGDPGTVMASPEVRDVYLGTEAGR